METGTIETGPQVDLRERPAGYQARCAACGQPRVSVRALLWWP
jgi:hypothetical protein